MILRCLCLYSHLMPLNQISRRNLIHFDLINGNLSRACGPCAEAVSSAQRARFQIWPVVPCCMTSHLSHPISCQPSAVKRPKHEWNKNKNGVKWVKLAPQWPATILNVLLDIIYGPYIVNKGIYSKRLLYFWSSKSNIAFICNEVFLHSSNSSFT